MDAARLRRLLAARAAASEVSARRSRQGFIRDWLARASHEQAHQNDRDDHG
jgi:hypothetical protein